MEKPQQLPLFSDPQKYSVGQSFAGQQRPAKWRQNFFLKVVFVLLLINLYVQFKSYSSEPRDSSHPVPLHDRPHGESANGEHPHAPPHGPPHGRSHGAPQGSPHKEDNSFREFSYDQLFEHGEHPYGGHDGSGHHRSGGCHGNGRHEPNGTSFRNLKKQAQDLVSKSHIRQSIEHYFTSGPHMAGQNFELANWTKSAFEKSGFETRIDTYDIWLNYPIGHRVALLNSDGSVKQELSLEEPVLEEDPTTGRKDRIPTFHGYSASGNATGELVYANFGRRADYDKIIDEGISIRDKVVLVRYGGIFRGLKVKFAEELGASAVLIYSDPAEDGSITEENGYEAYPDGPARNPGAVQRGSVQDLSHSPGDPTSPGFPSLPGSHENRTEPQGIPGIPSIPISYTDALPLLKALNNHGPVFPEWKGALDGIKYNVGPSKLEVNVENSQDYDFRPNYDVIATFAGESDEEVIIGNHRDSWIIGGADPNSGTAVLLEVARVLGELIANGWKPKRTIVLASWDGEEYGLLGSTEWGEDYAEHLKKKAVAYVNCDVGVSGPNLDVSANSLLRPIIERTVESISFNGTTLSDYWGGDRETRISPLGSGSDYTVFQDHLGIPSLDCGFAGGKDSPVYHYHSNFDSLHWMQKYGDPELLYHEAITKFVILNSLELIENDLLPFGIVEYARFIKHHIRSLLNNYDGPVNEEVGNLYNEARRFFHETRRFSHYAYNVSHELKHTRRGKGFWNYLKWLKLLVQRTKINNKLHALDQHFLWEEGLDQRPWFKHLIYAPGRYTGYAGQVFPGIAESLEDADDVRLHHWVEVVSDALASATDSLK